MRPVVYIAGPFRAINPDGTPDMFRVQQNVMSAMACGLEVFKLGGVAVIPHSNNMFFTGASGISDEFWLDADLEILRRCDGVFMVPNWRLSSGVTAEREYAVQHNLPVFDTLENLRLWIINICSPVQ